MKRLVDGVGQFVSVAHQPVMFGAGAGDADSVCFLKCVITDHECRHLS